MRLSESDGSSVAKVTSLRQSFRASLAAAGITAVLLFFLVGGGGDTSQALVAGLIFAAIGGAFTFWILRGGGVPWCAHTHNNAMTARIVSLATR